MKTAFLQRSVLSRLADVLFPVACVVCERPTSFSPAFRVCPECLEKIRWLDAQHTCQQCGMPLGPHAQREGGSCPVCISHMRYTHVAGVTRWGPVSSAVVHAFKFGGEFSLASSLGAAMARRICQEDVLPKIDVIIPVPLHPQRIWERGFDQAYLLACRIGRLLKKPVCRALERGVYTTPQSRLGAEERKRNLRNAFRPLRSLGHARTCLLVDDVMTTGTTAHECSAVLRDMGATRIEVLVFAR